MTLRRRALWGLLIAKAVASVGVGWDIRWHVVIGRDSFWIAPHVMTYAGVTVVAVLSLGVLVWETWAARHGRPLVDPALRVAGLVGTRGYHLAWWGIALTILAAPIDDLWHRLFGIDVTLWSPPHLLGLVGAQINSLACLLIAREVWPAGRARQAVLAIGGALLFVTFQTGVDPSVRTAFLHGGVRFFTYAGLGALFFTFSLVLTARLAGSRTMPVAVVAGAVALHVVTIGIGDAGFAVLQPESAVAGAIAADPASPIAVAHEIARRNGTTPGRGYMMRLLPLLPALVLALAHPRRRPHRAGVLFGMALYAVSAVALLRSPALAHVQPGVADALVALIATGAAAAVGAAGAVAFESRARDDAARSRRLPAAVAMVTPPA